MADKKTETSVETPETAPEELDSRTDAASQDTAASDPIEDAELAEDESDGQTGDEMPETPKEIDPADLAEAEQPVAPEPHEPEPAAETPKPAPAEPAKSGGFVAPLIGGVIAAAIGFGAATFLLPGRGDDALRQAISDQDQRLTTLTESLQKLTDSVSAQPADSALSEGLTRIEETLGSQLGGLSERLQGIETRLSEVEKRPLAEAPDMSGAIAAYERELEEMRAATTQARTEIEAVAAQAKEQEARGAMMRILAALEAGGPFASALPDLGVEPPQALAAVAGTGVATMVDLKADFPGAARNALNASLLETTGEAPTDRLTGFLRSQLGVRSLSPREGDDPDAVLSRAEAALGEGRVADAIAELSGLPDSGRAEMAGWIAAAQARLDATAAAADLAQQLDVN